MEKYEQDCRSRKIAYSSCAPWMGESAMNIYEFDPLEFDPAPEEITRALYDQAVALRKTLKWKTEKQVS